MDQIAELMKLVGEKLASVTKSDVVSGEPFTVGKFKVVPISGVTLGFGGGGGSGEAEVVKEGQAQQSKGSGGGSGGGARVRPVAVAVFGPDRVEILSIEPKFGQVAKLMDRIPDLVERVAATIKSHS